MLPEISLGEQIISRFTTRFGFKPEIWNSKVTKSQKKQILRGLINGTVKVIIGARSALFLPYKNLGMIVVDEEHDPSYKQNDGMLYNARDMAVLRGTIEHCITILGSATPSIESIYNVTVNKYELIELPGRFNTALMPDIHLVDMRQETLPKNNWLSISVREAIKLNLSKGQQTLIFLNRRGYAPLMLCKSCGYRANCKFCSASMVMHKELNRLECHHCGNIAPVYRLCPECNATDTLVLCGPGIERIEEEVKTIFPDCKTAIFSKEQSVSSGEIQSLLQKVENNEIDILIGTQIITKGYHFSELTLVVVVDADIGFAGGDLRASERTFQLLNQVGGRAGREDKKGQVVLQTYLPDHKVIQAFVQNKEKDFIETELTSRKDAQMPPFAKVATIMVTGSNPDKTKQMANKLLSAAPKSSVRILGPAEAMMYKLSGKYRYKILIIANKNFNLQKYLESWKSQASIPSTYQIKIDIDPQNLW
jgi:primosomal protein N' (replication factor Y)